MLFVPNGPNTFRAMQENVTTRPVAAMGTLVTPAVGSKGSWAEVFASLDYNTYGVSICINSNNTSTASRNTVLDVGIGAAASEVVLIPDLIAGNASGYTQSGAGIWYYFPMFIPAGTRVAVRAQGTVTTAFNVFMQMQQRPTNPSTVKTASFVEAIGSSGATGTTAVVGGVLVGAWTLMGTTAKACWFWQVGAQITSADTAHTEATCHIDLAVGNGTDFDIIFSSQVYRVNVLEQLSMVNTVVGREFYVAAGSSIYLRAQSSDTPEVTYFTVYGAGG